ncbi:MAG: glycoside hydrolase family 9 protein [Anaerolineae bacterium]|nr:glycoside hydrolase family 9 protein [Anaerolineae bacterium]NUQ03697.1 glycoside hydrolase family 9 protein [Anaerolineae bacterium]
MNYRFLGLVLLLLLPLTSLGAQGLLPYQNPDLPIDDRVADLLGRMTLEEKIGQMTQVEKNSIAPEAVARYFIGSVLSGGGGYPAGNNTVEGWAEMVAAYQDAALSTRLAIPMIYGVDAVHGHNNLAGAVLFPHNIGLGATRNAELVMRIGRITAAEMIATGIYWDFAPVLAVPQDYRWGRAYEGYGENTALVTALSTAMMVGLQGADLSDPLSVLATPKHYVGDGGTAFGTSPLSGALLDRGETAVDEATLREVHLAPYISAIEHGARSIMISFSSWNGIRMHGQDYLIQDVLRDELGFSGFIVSDWAGIDNVASTYYDSVVESINAGIDMVMVPTDYLRFIDAMTQAVTNDAIALERIDEAVANILRVKFELGLFDRPYAVEVLQPRVGSDEHRAVAREAVSQSLVLLKNENGALPIDAQAEQTVFVAGVGADNLGMQSGGWSIEWQGFDGSRATVGTTILTALQEGAGDSVTVQYSPRGRFDEAHGDIGIVVVGEPPYAEFEGDDSDLLLNTRDARLIAAMREQVDTLIVVQLSGRPLVIDASLNLADAWVAAWLPGTEGAGITDVLFGERDFVGRLPYTWLRSSEQLPFDFDSLPTEGCAAPLFPYGYGLSYADASAASPWLELAAECAPAPAVEAAPTAAPVVALPSAESGAFAASDVLAAIPGEVAYIPYPVPITLDGSLSDWDGIPFDVFTKGTSVSLDPAENGSVRFALASDGENLYLYMVMPDATIVTGEHGQDFWNEDSLEFYFNLSGDLARTNYGDGVFQVNINPGNIGNTDPAALVSTGVNASQSGFAAFVFRTADGWGFEAAVPIPDGVAVEQGSVIGFQAHGNGSSGGDRDVKLIWSNADTSDQSYLNPSLFGYGMFYEVGNTDVPESPERAGAVETPPQQAMSVNQVGYLPDMPHFGILANRGTFGAAWTLINVETGEVVFAGSTGRSVEDAASGDTLQIADFSAFNTPGTYRLMIFDQISDPFVIGSDIYATLPVDALRYFYLNRSGIALTADHAGEAYARPAGHLSDSAVTCYRGTDAAGTTWGGCDYTLNAAGGWYDAGDYGKYVVNGGISLWTLLNLYERLPEAFPDGSLNIPESGSGVSDLLDEARWEMEWLLSMQVPAGYPQAGMVHHKLHDLQWAGIPFLPPTEYDNNNDFSGAGGRYVYPPSTAATYNLAATAAQCARIWRGIDDAFAERCLQAAVTAFQAAQDNPLAIAGNTPGAGGGNYDDANVTDELFWAAAELYITTGEDPYAAAMRSTPFLTTFGGLGKNSSMSWDDTAALGALSLVLHRANLPEVSALSEQIVRTADAYLETIRTEGYRVPITTYEWGANSAVLNNALILAYAHDITGDAQYLHGVAESMDYLLGRNALALSFISGYGARAVQHPHHRFWANDSANGFPPPPPGVVVGGPNAAPSDPTTLEEADLDAGPARRYVDLIGSWSTNEVAINWNAPLVWVSVYLNQIVNGGGMT